MNPKVLIAGAGPVGLTLAVELTRYGVPVRIVDKAPAATDKSKAVVVWARTLELFDRAGLAEPLVAAGVKVKAANIVAGTRKIARFALDVSDTDYAYALMIPQYDTERILATHLRSLGVTVERGVGLAAFVDTGAGVRATIAGPDGASETVEADWLVGCDGAHSLVRHGLGMAFDGDTIPADFILADLRIAGGDLPVGELASYWHEKGVIIFLPLPGNRFRVIANMGSTSGTEAPEPTLAEVQAIIDERVPGGLIASDPVWLARFRINERKVEDYRSGRVFLAGDAAHIHSPAGGQGMNTGMQDAFNLAWKLALVVEGTCGEDLLASYSPERSAVAETVIAESGRLTKLAMLSNHFAQGARNFVARHLLGLKSVRRAAAEVLSEIGISYETSALNGGHARGLGGPLPGHRLSPRGRRPIGAGASPRFALFAGDAGEATAALRARHARLLEDDVRPAVAADGIWLVRPDGYVAMSAAAGDWKAVGDYLDALAPREPGASVAAVPTP